MKKTLPVLLLFIFSPCALAAIALSENVPYTQNFDTLASSGTSSTLPTDWVLAETGTGANTTYSAGTGSGNTGDTYSFGAAAATERALGSLTSAALSPRFGASFSNSLTAGSINITISYVGEQWRLGSAGTVDRLAFEYSTDATSLSTGTWTAVVTLDFVAPVTTGTSGALDGNLTANKTSIGPVTISNVPVAPSAVFWIRWTDGDAVNSDHGMAVDNFSITAVSVPEASIVSCLGLLGGLSLLHRRR